MRDWQNFFWLHLKKRKSTKMTDILEASEGDDQTFKKKNERFLGKSDKLLDNFIKFTFFKAFL